MDDHDATLVAADAGVLALRQQPDEVGQLARDLCPRIAAACDDEGEQPAALGRVALDVRELEHLEHVVLQLQALAERLQLERVLGEARVGAEALAAAEAEHEVVVVELEARAVEVPAGDDLARIEVDRLDLGDVHLRGREDPSHRAEHAARPDPTRDHLPDEAMEGVEVVTTDNSDVDLAALDRPPELAGQRDRDVAAAEHQDVRGHSYSGSSSVVSAKKTSLDIARACGAQ